MGKSSTRNAQLIWDESGSKVQLNAQSFNFPVQINGNLVCSSIGIGLGIATPVEIVDFKNIHKDWNLFKCDDMFYCLGTTRSETSKKADYHKIEHDYCLNIAKISHHNNVNKFLYISSSGANLSSWLYYLKIKGEVEFKLKEIGFNYLHIFRPYVLMGKREEFRFWESITRFFLKLFNFMMVGYLKKMKGMPATLLAKSMVHYAKQNKKGVFIHTNRQIHELFPKK